MTDRCEWCNHKSPGHDVLCRHYKPATSAELMRHHPIRTHEEIQHAAAHGPIMRAAVALGKEPGDGDVCGSATPNCTACGKHHRYGECPSNYVATEARILEPIIRKTLEVVKDHLPVDPAARKAVPLASGCLDYFPDALAAVAATSLQGSRQHHPDEPLHWDRSKSGDEADALLRHLVQRGTIDTDGIRHSAKVAWRALALLQKEIEDAAGHGAGSPKAA